MNWPLAPVVAACGLLLLSSGCARFVPQPLSPEKNAAALEQRSLANPALKPFLETNLHRVFAEWPARAWDVDMLACAAFYYQPDLAVARAQWAVARGAEKTAAQRPNPSVSISPAYNTTTFADSPWLVTATLDVPIETAGKRGYRRAQAAHLSEAARLNIATVAWQARRNVRSALLDFAAAAQRAKALEEQLALQEQLVQRVTQQVEAGALARSDTVPAQLAVAKARLEFSDAQRTQVEARARLAEAVGVPAHALNGVELTFDLNRKPDPDLTSAAVRRAALLGRSDVIGALADYAASQSALQLEIAKQYPDFHLQPGYEFDQGDNKWALGFSVELPVLNRNEGPIAEAKARRDEAAAKFNALQARVMAEIDRSIEVLRVTQTNSSALAALAQSQSARRQSVEAQFKAGAADQLELLNARLEAATTALLELDSLVRLQQAAGALEDAVQRPLNFSPAIFQSTQTP